MKQITITAMNLNSIKASRQRPLHRGDKCPLEILYVFLRHCLGLRMVLVIWNRRRCKHKIRPATKLVASNIALAQPRRDDTRLSTNMPKLYHHLLSLAVCKLDN